MGTCKLSCAEGCHDCSDAGTVINRHERHMTQRPATKHKETDEMVSIIKIPESITIPHLDNSDETIMEFISSTSSELSISCIDPISYLEMRETPHLPESNDSINYEMEGELIQYKPVLRNDMQSRWCKLTPTHFQYYKDRVSTILQKKPLFSIPFTGIHKVNV